MACSQSPGSPAYRLQVHLQKINNCGVCTTVVVVGAQGNCGSKLSHSILGMKTSLLAHLHSVEGMSWTHSVLCFVLARHSTNYGTHWHKTGELNRKPPCTPSLYSKENICVRYFVKQHTILVKTNKPLIQKKMMPYKIL